MDGTGRLAEAPAAMPDLAASQDAPPTNRVVAPARTGGRRGVALGTQRPGAVVERRGKPHERRLPESMVRRTRAGQLARPRARPPVPRLNRAAVCGTARTVVWEVLGNASPCPILIAPTLACCWGFLRTPADFARPPPELAVPGHIRLSPGHSQPPTSLPENGQKSAKPIVMSGTDQ